MPQPLNDAERILLSSWNYLWRTRYNNGGVDRNTSDAIDIIRIAWIGFGRAR